VESCFCQIAECILCGAQLHSQMPPEQVCQIRGMLSRHSYAARELLFREGDPGTHLILIREGLVKLTVSGADGQEQIFGFGEPGHIIGFDTVDDKTYTFTAETKTPVVACKIQRKDMLRVLEHSPNVSLRVVRMLNSELARANGLIRVLGQKSPVERIATFILSLAPQKHDPSRKLLLPLSREEMAKTVGLRVETVSRVMADLQRRGVIEAPRGHIRILDFKSLRSLGGISSLPSQAAGNPPFLSLLRART
jgi:CRP/FNR family transcriptional regulator